MRKIFQCIVAITLVLGLVACGNKTDTSSSMESVTASSNPPISVSTGTSLSEPADSQTADDTVSHPPVSADLSKEWSSFQLELEGKIYTLPVSYAELEADGWKVKDEEDLTETLEADQYFLSYITLTYNNNENNEISARFANLGDKEIPINECYVSGFQFAEYSWNKNTSLYFPGGITLGTTKEEVSALYKEPNTVNETSTTIEWKYQVQNYDDVMLTFDSESGKLTQMRMTNSYLP